MSSADIEPSRRSLGLATLAPLVALVAWLFLWPLWWPGEARRYIPEGDLSSQYLPLRHYVSERLSRGELPLWNPYLFAGQPALADIQSAALYPVQLVYSFAGFGSYVALETQVALHLAIAVLGGFCFAWRLTGSRLGGVAAGFAYGLGGYLTSFPVQQLTILSTAAWLPWLLLAMERLATSPQVRRRAVALAVLTATTVLAGHPQTALLAGYTAVAFVVWRLWRTRQAGRRAAWAAAGVALGLALAGAQLLPTFEFIRLSTRRALTLGEASGGFGLHEIAAVLYPGYFGGSPQYLGAASVVFVAIALSLRRYLRVAFWAWLATAGLMLSFGTNTFLHYAAYLLLPGYGASRNPERAVLLLAAGSAVLAGFGAARLARLSLPRDELWLRAVRRWLVGATGAAVVMGVLLWAGTGVPLPTGGINLFGGILKQHLWLLLAAAAGTVLVHAVLCRRISPAVATLCLVSLMLANLYATGSAANIGPAPAAVTGTGAGDAAAVREALAPGYRFASGGLLPEGPSAGTLYSVADTTGNTPMQLAAYATFRERLPQSRQQQLLAVAAVAVRRGAAAPEGTARIPGAADAYSVTEAAHPVRLAHSAIAAVDDAVWQALSDPRLDVNATTVTAGSAALAAAEAPEHATVLRWTAEEIVVEIEAASPAMAVLSLIAYPGWQATLNGAPASWQVCDGVLVGVPVTAGRAWLRMTYAPTSFALGSMLSGCALLTIVGLALAGGESGRRA